MSHFGWSTCAAEIVFKRHTGLDFSETYLSAIERFVEVQEIRRQIERNEKRNGTEGLHYIPAGASAC